MLFRKSPDNAALIPRVPGCSPPLSKLSPFVENLEEDKGSPGWFELWQPPQHWSYALVHLSPAHLPGAGEPRVGRAARGRGISSAFKETGTELRASSTSRYPADSWQREDWSPSADHKPFLLCPDSHHQRQLALGMTLTTSDIQGCFGNGSVIQNIGEGAHII